MYVDGFGIPALFKYFVIPSRLSPWARIKKCRQKGRISPKTVQYIVKNTLEKAGLKDRELSTHKLRHTAATLMYQYGNVDVLAIKEILGHESLSTTQIYTHIMDEQLQKAADSNPLSSVKAPKRPIILPDNDSGEDE